MNITTRLNKAITALMLLLFVVYCSVGVCTSLMDTLAMGDDSSAQAAHAHHQMSDDNAGSESASHCGSSESCEWSRNLVADPALDVPADFFFVYLLATVSLIFLLYRYLSRERGRYAFARDQFFQFTYPRLHLQHAVFLN